MSEPILNKWIQVTDIHTGNDIQVNANTICRLEVGYSGSGTYIRFVNDKGIEVSETMTQVINLLEAV